MGNAYLRSAPYYPPLNAQQLMSDRFVRWLQDNGDVLAEHPPDLD